MGSTATFGVVLIVAFVSLHNGFAGVSSRLPFARELAGDAELPKPLGIGLNLHYQDQRYSLSRLRLDLENPLPGIDLNRLLRAAEIGIDNNLYELNMKMDAWLLPFLNVFGLIGYIDGETRVDVDGPAGSIRIDIDYSGMVYGAGMTVTYGWEVFFASLTGTLTESELDTSTSSVSAWVLSPKIGACTDIGSFWAGAMYQETEEDHVGSQPVELLGREQPVVYDAELEQEEAWNYLLGYTTTLWDCLEVNIEGGVGQREQFTVGVKP